MYIRNKTNIENLRVKANNCYIILDEFSLDSVRDSILNRYVCSSILRNIITNEINNFNTLRDYLKSILFYQVKVIEKEQEKFNYEQEYERVNRELADLEEQRIVYLSQGIENPQIETLIFNKRQEANHLSNEIGNLSIVIENMKTSFTTYRTPTITTSIPLSSAYFENIEVDLNHLDSNRNYVKFLYDKFNSDAKEPYVDSDITEYFEGYAFHTDKVYDLVLESLNRIYNAFDYYINDCSNLEKSLSKQIKPGMISNSELITLLHSMPDLVEYNNKINTLLDKANATLEKEHDVSEIENEKAVKKEAEDTKEEKVKETKKTERKETVKEEKVVSKTLDDMGIKPSLINEKLKSIKISKTNIKKLQPGDILSKDTKLSMITSISKGKVKIVKENNEMYEIPVAEIGDNYDKIFIMDKYNKDIEDGDNNEN